MSATLFPEHQNLPDGFGYQSDFLNVENRNSLFETLWNAPIWKQEPVRMFGKWVLQPRLTAYVADPACTYSYAGAVQTPLPWTDELARLRDQVAAQVSQHLGQTVSFNAVLLNGYRGGADGMGWHRDNEPELGPQPVIASVSLGALRRFSVRTYGEKKRWDIGLEPGSLLWMHGDSQQHYEHAVPKTANPVGPRINLTFRHVRASGLQM